MNTVEWSHNSVSTSGFATQVTTTQNANIGIQLVAPSSNPTVIFVGNSGVTVNNGYPLYPYDSLLLPVRHPDEVFTISSGLLNTVRYIVF